MSCVWFEHSTHSWPYSPKIDTTVGRASTIRTALKESARARERESLDRASSGFQQARAALFVVPLKPTFYLFRFYHMMIDRSDGRTASGLVSYGVLNGLWYSCGIAYVTLGPMGVVPAGGGIEGTISTSVKQFGKVPETMCTCRFRPCAFLVGPNYVCIDGLAAAS